MTTTLPNYPHTLRYLGHLIRRYADAWGDPILPSAEWSSAEIALDAYDPSREWRFASMEDRLVYLECVACAMETDA